MDVSIIIVNYNTKKLLSDCLDSVQNFVKNINYEVIVVDNNSNDGSADYLKKKYVNVNVIALKENLGFGRANNLGVSLASGKYIFLLNSDTVLIDNVILKLYNFHECYKNDLEIGVLGVSMVDQNNVPNSYGLDFPTAKFERNLILQRLFPFFKFGRDKNINDFQLLHNNIPIRKVDYVIGADMFIEKTLFDEMNGFDRNFFLYYEETDLQLRIHKMKNLKNYILTEEKIIHLEGQSSGGKKNNKAIGFNTFKFSTDSFFYYLKKHKDRNIVSYKFVYILYLLISIFNTKYSLRENIKKFFYGFSKTFIQ